MSKSDVVRVAAGFNGLESMVASNHSFSGVGTIGRVEVRWLQCSCSGCFCDSDSSKCDRTVFNTSASRQDIQTTKVTDTKKSDERIEERSKRVERRLKQDNGETLVPLFLGEDNDAEAKWMLGETYGKPRHVKSGDIVGGKWSTRSAPRNSESASDFVVEVFQYSTFGDPAPNKKRRFFQMPHQEKCAKPRYTLSSNKRKQDECRCGKWHRELQWLNAVRLPIVESQNRKRNFKESSQVGTGVFELNSGIGQQVDACLVKDERVFVEESKVNLPTFLSEPEREVILNFYRRSAAARAPP